MFRKSCRFFLKMLKGPGMIDLFLLPPPPPTQVKFTYNNLVSVAYREHTDIICSFLANPQNNMIFDMPVFVPVILNKTTKLMCLDAFSLII